VNEKQRWGLRARVCLRLWIVATVAERTLWDYFYRQGLLPEVLAELDKRREAKAHD